MSAALHLHYLAIDLFDFTHLQSSKRLLFSPWLHTGPIEGNIRAPIHRPAPLFTEQGKSQEILVTGIKVVDLLAPYAKGGKIGLFGGAGVGKTVSIRTRATSHHMNACIT